MPAVSAIDAPAVPAARGKKHGWLPVLTVLFVICYSLMTMLIVEQGQTIESQRALIRELLRDSAELSAVKQKAAQESAQSAKSQVPLTQYPSTQTPVTQTPSAQIPLNQTPNSKAPSSQAGPQTRRQQGQAAPQKPDFQMPTKPASDLVDDVHTLITI